MHSQAPAPLRLRQLLGAGFGVAVAVGSMIGAGILRAPADIAARLPVDSLFLGVWVLGGAYALLGANAIAELSTMTPSSGGLMVFARRAFGPFAGLVVGWNDWLSASAAIAAVALVFAESVRTLAGGGPPPAVVAMAAVALLALALWRGVREGARAQAATSAAKAVVLLGLVLLCGWHAATHPASAWTTVALPIDASLLAAVVLALQGVIYAYDGWAGVTYFGEEVRDPARDIPRSLFGGLLSVLALYLLINVAFLLVLPLPDLARAPLAAASVAERVVGAWGGTLVNAIVVAVLPSSMIANLLMGSRISFALARDRVAPRALLRVNAGGTPTAGLAATAGAAMLFLLTGTFERVIALASFLFVAGYLLSFAAVFALRRREPDAPRPWRARGHPWTTGLALLGSIAFLAGVVVTDPASGLIALALVAASGPVWWMVRRA